MEQKICNFSISRSRRIVENAFDILAKTFRVYRQPINLTSEKRTKLVKATCSLHNGLRKMSINYILLDLIDPENIDNLTITRRCWRDEVHRGLRDVTSLRPSHSSNKAMQV